MVTIALAAVAHAVATVFLSRLVEARVEGLFAGIGDKPTFA
jgi:hypothetical protein